MAICIESDSDRFASDEGAVPNETGRKGGRDIDLKCDHPFK